MAVVGGGEVDSLRVSDKEISHFDLSWFAVSSIEEIFGGFSLNGSFRNPNTFLDCGFYCYNTISFNEITVTAVEWWHFSYWPHVIILVGKVPGGKLTNWQWIVLLRSLRSVDIMAETKTATIALFLLISSHSSNWRVDLLCSG